MRILLVPSIFFVVGCSTQETIVNKANPPQGENGGQSTVAQDLRGVDFSLLCKDAKNALGVLREALVNKNDNLTEIIMPFILLVNGYHFRRPLGEEFSDVIPLLKRAATDPSVDEVARIMAANLLGKLSGTYGVVEWEKGELQQFLGRIPDWAKDKLIGSYKHPRKEEILEIFQFFSENPLPEEPWDFTVVMFVSDHVLFDTSEKYPLSTEEAIWWMKEVTTNKDLFAYHRPAGVFFPKSLLRGQAMQAGSSKSEKLEEKTHEVVAAQGMPHEETNEDGDGKR